MGGDEPQQPQAPDPYATAAAQKKAYIDFYPQILALQEQYQPQESRTQAASLSDAARAYLGREQEFGADTARARMETARAYDPLQTKARDLYGQKVIADMELGNQLSDKQLQLIEQGIRSGQAARNNMRGGGPNAQETMAKFIAGNTLENQRFGRGYQYAQSTNPYMTAGGGVGTGAGGSYGDGGGQGSASGIAQGMTGNMAQMAQQQYGQAMQNYNQQQANYVSPWAAGATGAMGGAAAGAQVGTALGGPGIGTGIGAGLGLIGGLFG